MFDIQQFRNISQSNNRYERRLEILRKDGLETKNIESVVNESVKNIEQGIKSFVIYGEPQSGKTEMMISLTAKLLDSGHKIIVVLLNDNVRLLNQNLDRFQRSGIDPTPINFSEILEENIGDRKWIIFSKKNARDLRKLLNKLDKKQKIIIDDEADFASPNAKINKNDRTTINKLIHELLGEGIYIGVTATPARLDLNNTFENITERWVNFAPHKEYVGKDIFFPVVQKKTLDFSLRLLPTNYDAPQYLREALLSFLVNVATLNLKNNKDDNYCLLIHTSGKKADHDVDHKIVIKMFDIISDDTHKEYEKYVRMIWEIAQNRTPIPHDIVTYVLKNIGRKTIVVLNSERDTDTDPTNPPSLFTITIGGNIVSRGVTFNNLLSMFFTRDVKHQMQQDTYIQRARMFGRRGGYINYFELWISEDLYKDWHKCFVYHYLSLESIKSNSNAPIWIADNRIQPAAKTSIDNRTVVVDGSRGSEMSFKKFRFNDALISVKEDKGASPIQKLDKFNAVIGDEIIPRYVIDFIKQYSPNGDQSVVIHDIRNVDKNSDYHDDLYRKKGVFGGREIEDFPHALHHVLMLRNSEEQARVIYKYVGNVKFFKNLGLNRTI